jgi:hypothetical protein
MLLIAALFLTAIACGGGSSDLTVAYRGDTAANRVLVHVQLDTGARARLVTPAFPSAARPEPVATRGALPIDVAVVTATGDTAARYVTVLHLTPRTAYQLGIVIGRRPAASSCNGVWFATPLAAPLGEANPGATRAESLYVSVTITDRAKELPRCDD